MSRYIHYFFNLRDKDIRQYISLRVCGNDRSYLPPLTIQNDKIPNIIRWFLKMRLYRIKVSI